MEGLINILGGIVVVVGIIYLWGLFYNSREKIVLELDNKYYNPYELMNAAVEQLENQGKVCEKLDGFYISIEGKKYLFQEMNLNYGEVPVQQAQFKRVRRKSREI